MYCANIDAMEKNTKRDGIIKIKAKNNNTNIHVLMLHMDCEVAAIPGVVVLTGHAMHVPDVAYSGTHSHLFQAETEITTTQLT